MIFGLESPIEFCFLYSVNMMEHKEASIVRYFLFVCTSYLLVPPSLQNGQREEVDSVLTFFL
jgi:hypothetical protein